MSIINICDTLHIEPKVIDCSCKDAKNNCRYNWDHYGQICKIQEYSNCPKAVVYTEYPKIKKLTDTQINQIIDTIALSKILQYRYDATFEKPYCYIWDNYTCIGTTKTDAILNLVDKILSENKITEIQKTRLQQIFMEVVNNEYNTIK